MQCHLLIARWYRERTEQFRTTYPLVLILLSLTASIATTCSLPRDGCRFADPVRKPVLS